MVVDKASTDGSSDSLEGIPTPLKIIKNPENKALDVQATREQL